MQRGDDGDQQQQRPSSDDDDDQPPPKKVFCAVCNVHVDAKKYGGHLRTNDHKVNATRTTDDANVRLLQSAFRNRLATYQLLNTTEENLSITTFLSQVKDKFVTLVRKQIVKHTIVRIGIEVFAEYFLEKNDSTSIKSFNTKSAVVSRSSDLDAVYDNFCSVVDVKSSEFSERDSGWAIVRILNVELSVARYACMDGTSSAPGSYIRLPLDIERKKAVLNIQNNTDSECFRWCILAHLHPVSENPHRVNKYIRYIDELDFTGMEFPVQLTDIAKFERLNPTISVNVYGLKESVTSDFRKRTEIIGPLYFTSAKRANHVNLLVVEDSASNNFHYCLIRSMSRLVGSRISAHMCQKYLCDGCLNWFASQRTYANHIQHECDHVVCVVPTTEMVKDKFGRMSQQNKLKFTQYEKSLQIPFVIYYDFETALCKIDDDDDGDDDTMSQPSTDAPFTTKTHHHVPHSFAYYIKCSFNDALSTMRKYRGRDAAKKFVEWLHEDAKRLYKDHLNLVIPMRQLTTAEQALFVTATHCQICEKPFSADDDGADNYRVRHHCHLTGEFVGICHNICNLQYKVPHFIPCVAHNSSKYDTSLFIRELAESCNDNDDGSSAENITCIPQTKEQYITFSKRVKVDEGQFVSLRFVDSYRFMAASLDTLASNLTDAECAHISKFFPNSDQFALMRKKGVFPYSFVDAYDKLDTTTSLPPQNAFFDQLKQRHVVDEEYARAQQIWQVFKCATLGDYSDLYLQVDVLLLTDVMETFRKVCMQTYDLDPLHFVTAPGLSWTAMLKHTKVELELLTDLEMVHFLRRGIRGGMCQCNVRKATANNPFLADTFDDTQDTSYLMYLDVTNLYGWAMTQPLPISDFKFLDRWDEEEILRTAADSNVGYILEVDLHYPQSIHDAHNDLPFCAEPFVPPTKSKNSKLCTTLHDKSHYVIHYVALQQALKHGLKLTKVHRVMQFTQRAWLKAYIELNTGLRRAARNKFEKDFFKLLINSIFGKALEAVHKRVDVKLLTHWLGRYGAGRRILSPFFKNFTIFAENFVAVQLRKSRIVYDKPIYVGFTVLEISKVNMYAFLYDYLKRKYMERVVLAYIDTDSFLLKIYTENVYKDLAADAHMYDLSNYPVSNVHGITPGESVVGRMKDEYAGRIVREFLGTGAKAYCVDVEGSGVTKKAKGVNRSVIEDRLTRDDYNHIVCTSGAKIYRTMHSIRRFQHHLYTIYQNKVSLSSFDDKRCVTDASFQTMSWGHYKLN